MTFEEEHIKFNNEYGNCKSVNYHRDLRDHFKDWQPPKPLPEVPQFVADYIEYTKRENKSFRDVIEFEPLYNSNDEREKLVEWFNKNSDRFVRAWLDGYTVEKEKKFYLKSKSLLISYSDYEEPDVDELYFNKDGNLVISESNAYKFTQQEIDSMEVGSYEQIEVEE
ncbi:DUF1642 domain-containing protein [Lactococcus sp.]|uniref:DUF1642 domain-containing protein n=1 Tax=Lactococcus sp. TaxID=44273 RepID=UPI0035B0F6E8